MKQKTIYFFAFHLLYFSTPLGLQAESWPTLEKYVSDCVLIVKARQVGPFRGRVSLSFEVTETWKGQFDPREFIDSTPEGYILARQGEHGVRFMEGQEIVFFFTRDNQPHSKLSRPCTAFPIVDGTLIYGFTSDDPNIRRYFTAPEFKRAIEVISVQKDAE